MDTVGDLIVLLTGPILGVDIERPVKINVKFNQASLQMEDNLLCVPTKNGAYYIAMAIPIT